MTHVVVLAAITLVAAIVNGALGYGFSSITVPLALLIVTSRVLNPSLVLLEVALNAYVLWVNRAAIAAVWRRVLPVALGIGPGVAVGTAVLASVNPSWLKLGTFALLLPVILLQAAGFRRPIGAERALGAAFGTGVGALYAITTISGPPLATFLTNQGYAKRDFRAALGLVRITEAVLTTVAYSRAGLITVESASLLAAIVPSVAVGVPLGAWMIRHVRVETFRRVCMSFDAGIVAFGMSTLLRQLRLVEGASAYLLFAAVLAVDWVLLYRFFRPSSGERVIHTEPQPQLP